jgi:hypothetical protein
MLRAARDPEFVTLGTFRRATVQVANSHAEIL